MIIIIVLSRGALLVFVVTLRVIYMCTSLNGEKERETLIMRDVGRLEKVGTRKNVSEIINNGGKLKIP